MTRDSEAQPAAATTTTLATNDGAEASKSGNSDEVHRPSQTDVPDTPWLLRLFQSEFFNTWMAVSYLYKYPDNVGLQYYLCETLTHLPIAAIEFMLPQLWYISPLLISCSSTANHGMM